MDEIENIEKRFLLNRLTLKIKYSTLCNSFKTDGLRNIDINTKITSCQCCWIKWLHDANFHEWTLIPLHLIHAFITFAFKFHQSIVLNVKLGQFPKFYQKSFHFLGTCFRSASTVLSILVEFLWFTRNI